MDISNATEAIGRFGEAISRAFSFAMVIADESDKYYYKYDEKERFIFNSFKRNHIFKSGVHTSHRNEPRIQKYLPYQRRMY